LPAKQETHRTLAATKFKLFVVDWSHYISIGARGGHQQASHPVLEAGGGPKELLDSGQGHNEEATAARSPNRSLPPKG
jgi:hypothetical protein